MPNIELQAWVTLIKDIFAGFAAFVAAYIGIRGFDTWKKQLTANAERDLARRVLVAVYKVRDIILFCRFLPIEDDEDPRIQKLSKELHQSEFKKLDEAEAGLHVELLEAEAVWGDELDYRAIILKFQLLIEQLEQAYSTYYSEYSFSPDKAKAYTVLFTKWIYPRDEFSAELDEAVNKVENFLRPKLTLKQARRRAWWHRFKK